MKRGEEKEMNGRADRVVSALFGVGMLALAFLVDLDNLPIGVSYWQGFAIEVASATAGIWCSKYALRL